MKCWTCGTFEIDILIEALFYINNDLQARTWHLIGVSLSLQVTLKPYEIVKLTSD